MPSPFPGMNPYLESPTLWQKIHKRLIVASADSLSPQLRLRVLGSFTNLVEIDLLRNGKPMQILYSDIQSDYRILVSRGDDRPQADLYAFNLQNTIPSFPLPLRLEDVEPVVDLQTLLSELYDRASYDLIIDYSKEPVPPLLEADAAWVDALLREKGLR